MIAVITILYDVNIEYIFYIAGFYLVFWFVAMGMQYKAFKERRAREAEKSNLTDSEDQMKWVQLMNSIRNSAEEVVLRDLIYA